MQSCSLEFTKKIVYSLEISCLNQIELHFLIVESFLFVGLMVRKIYNFIFYTNSLKSIWLFLFHYGLPNITIFDQLKNKILNIKSRPKSKNKKNISLLRLYYLDLAYRRLRTCLISVWLSKIDTL